MYFIYNNNENTNLMSSVDNPYAKLLAANENRWNVSSNEREDKFYPMCLKSQTLTLAKNQ